MIGPLGLVFFVSHGRAEFDGRTSANSCKKAGKELRAYMLLSDVSISQRTPSSHLIIRGLCRELEAVGCIGGLYTRSVGCIRTCPTGEVYTITEKHKLKQQEGIIYHNDRFVRTTYHIIRRDVVTCIVAHVATMGTYIRSVLTLITYKLPVVYQPLARQLSRPQILAKQIPYFGERGQSRYEHAFELNPRY